MLGCFSTVYGKSSLKLTQIGVKAFISRVTAFIMGRVMRDLLSLFG